MKLLVPLCAAFLLPTTLLAAQPPLGIECAAEQGWGPKSQAANAAFDRAEAAGDWKAAIAAQRVMAGEQCDNAYLWIKLSLVYARAGQAKEALEVGAFTFERFPNQVAASLSFPESEGDSFREMKALPGFAESELARRLAARFAEREARSKKAREAVAALPAAERPPELYVAKEACPFECCMFGEWSVEEKIELFKAPAGAALGRGLKPGDEVVGLTGEVHLRPLPMLVGYPLSAETALGSDQRVAIPIGQVVYRLDSLGEGFFRFWYRGQTFEIPAPDSCLVFDEECWGDPIDPAGTPEVYQWWVKIRLKDGSEAWARDQGFGNMDGCA